MPLKFLLALLGGGLLMYPPNESRSGPNPEISAESDPMPESAGPAASSNQAIGGNAPLPGNAVWIDFTSDEGGKSIGNLDLAGLSGVLEAMPLHWYPKTGIASFQGLPASLNGKMAD